MGYTVNMISRRYVAEFVYGGIDGTITTFAIVSGAMGAGLSPAVVLILGFANLFADGFSMAVSNYLSVKSQNQLYAADGHATHHTKAPIKTALATFISFVAIGFVPLVSFVAAAISGDEDGSAFMTSIILTAVVFLGIGVARGAVTRSNKVYTALVTFAMGATASVIAFAVGYVLQSLA